MTVSPRARLIRRVVIALAIAMFVMAGAIMAEMPNNFPAQGLAMALLLAGVALARSRAAHPELPPGWMGGEAQAEADRKLNRPGCALWIACVVSSAGALVSFWLMLVSQAHGGHVVWPLYSFVAYVIVGAGVSGALVAKLVRLWWH